MLEELGSDAYVFFPVDAPKITAEAIEATEEDASLLAEERSLFTARVDPRTAARVGGTLRLAVDPARFHFFDPATGASLIPQGAELPEAAASAEPGADGAIWSAVAALPEGQRFAVALRYAADLPYREIGEALDCSEAAARRRVADGLATLRRTVDEQEVR